MTPAATFHLAACSVLESGGISPTKSMIARIVGERPNNYAGMVSGQRTCSVDKVCDWIDAWRAAGHLPLALVRKPGGVVWVGPVADLT